MSKIKKINYVIAGILINSIVLGSHIVGGYITYKCIGQDSFLITLTLYRDCKGISMNPTEYVDVFFQSCGQTTSLTLTGTSVEVSQLCPQYLPQSACNGGNLPGMEKWTYTGVLVIPPGCNGQIQLSWSSCCKNDAIVNIQNPSSYGTTLITTYNSNIAPCDNGVVISSMPVPYVCANQNVNYNYGITDFDGDSIYVQFTSSLDDLGNPVPYSPGYSPTSPIPGINLDPLAGNITFTAPGITGNYVVTIIIYQYDANGNLIGTIMQETQFVVITGGLGCSPPPSLDSISNLITTSGNVVIDTTGNTPKIIACQGTDFCLDVWFSSTTPNDSLFLSSDVAQILPGASFSQNGYNPAAGHICWNIPPLMPASNYVIAIQAQNNNCPIPGMAIQYILVEVVENTYAGKDTTICLGQSVQLQASGGTQFNWQSISGDPIIVGQNFSCNNCPNPIATPSQNTTYVVTSNLTAGCKNTDTITVYVVPDFNVSISSSNSSPCMGSSISFSANPTPSGNYQWNWEPNQIFNNPTVQNPTTIPLCLSGNLQVTLTVKSQAGCIKKFTHNVTVSNAQLPYVSISTSNFNTCPKDTSTIILSVDPTQGICPSTYNIGTQSGQNTSTNWPSPYAHWYRTDHHLFLIRQSELVAAGVPPLPAKIKSISFLVSSIPPGMNTALPNYRIQMGNTTINSLTGFVGGLTTVFFSNPYNITTGWNKHTLSTPFQWDGTSNLLIDVCSGDLSVIYSYNAICPYTTTPFTSTYYDYSDAVDVCTTTNWPTPSNNRPIIRIEFESSTASGITYVWNPPLQIISQPNDSTLIILNPDTTTTYIITVSDSLNTCNNTLTVTIPVNTLKTKNDTSLCLASSQQVELWASGTSYCSQGTPTYTWAPSNYLSNPSSSNPLATIPPLSTITFYVSFTDQCGCTLVDSVKVYANPLPEISVTHSPSFSCPPLKANILIDSTTASECLWLFYHYPINNTPKLIDSLQGCFSFPYLLKQPGYYTPVVIIKNQYGCVDTIKWDSVYYVGIQPDAAYSYSPQFLTTYSNYLNVYNTSLNYDSIIWILNNTDTIYGNTGTIKFPSDTGHYPLTLVVVSKDGCIDTITYIIEVKEEYAVWIPNAFSPNGDGINDLFFIKYNGIYVDKKRFEIWIFDRWGEVVFYSTDPDFQWDGRHYKRKHKLPQGTYPVKIKTIEKITNKPITINSVVNILY